MKAAPLIVHTAGAYQGPSSATLLEIEARVAALESFDRLLRDRSEAVRREDGIHYAEILPGLEVWRALYDRGSGFPPDLQGALGSILDRTQMLDDSDLAATPPIAQTGLWPSAGRFVCDELDWLAFRRDTLVDCGVTPETFCKQVATIFPSLVLSSEFPKCLETLEGGFEMFLPVVVRALTALETRLLPTLGNLPIVDGLKQFTAASGFSTTMEGSAERNEALTFAFGSDQSQRRLVCAPHMKLDTSPMSGDTRHYYNRIYFNPHQDDPDTVRIHVGHVGCHL